MQDVMQPVIEAEKNLDAVRTKAIDILLAERGKIDEKLERLGHSTKRKRGRPAAPPTK
jgi:hypothetical protein